MIEEYGDEIGFCTFQLNGDRYAIDILTVQEVNKHCEVTPVFGAPAWVRGLLNLRGQVVTVVDTGVALNLGPRETTETSRLIILKTTGELSLRGHHDLTTCEDLVGLHVDAVSDVIKATIDEVEPAPAGTGEAAVPAVRGVVQLEGEVLRVIDPGLLLDFEEVEAR